MCILSVDCNAMLGKSIKEALCRQAWSVKGPQAASSCVEAVAGSCCFCWKLTVFGPVVRLANTVVPYKNSLGLLWYVSYGPELLLSSVKSSALSHLIWHGHMRELF